jgi:TP901 family phage tail tape measure protein
MPIQVPVTQTGLEASIQAAAQRAGRNLKIDLGVSSRSIGALSQPLGKITGQADQFTKSMEAANARVLAFGASVGVLSAVAQGFSQLVAVTIQVEKNMADINSVLQTNSANLNKFKNDIFSVAKETGNSFQTVSDAALELSRQGLKSDEVLRRLKDSMILSRLSGLDAASAVEGLTAAVNSFSKEGVTTSDVLNKISKTAAAFSVSERDLIEGFKRSASVAQQAGVSLDELGGIITAVQQKTARGGAVIGNAFKTIFTRIQRPDSLAALQDIGAAVTDAQGGILPATKLIENLAVKMKGLNDIQVANITEKIGGGFQVGPLIAALDDITSKTSTFKGATEAMATAGGEAYKRNTALNQTLAASINMATVNLQELANTLGEIGVTDSLKNILSFFNSFATNVKDVLQGEGLGSDFAKGLVKGISAVLSGPGLLLFGAIIAKLSINFVQFGAVALKTFFNIGSAAKEIGAIQSTIASTLLNNKSIQTQILALEGNRVAQAQFFSTALNTQLATMEKMRTIAASIAPVVYGATTGAGKPRAAGGYMPTVMAEANDISKGVGGARSSDRPVIVPNFAFGGGKTGTMVANTGEHIVPNYNGGSGSAIFNRDMVGRMGLPNGAQKIGAAGGFIPNFAAAPKDFGKYLSSQNKKPEDILGTLGKPAPRKAGNLDKVWRDDVGGLRASYESLSETDRRNLNVQSKQQSQEKNISQKSGKYGFIYPDALGSSIVQNYNTPAGNVVKSIPIQTNPSGYLYKEIRDGLVNSSLKYASNLGFNPDIVNEQKFKNLIDKNLNPGSIESAYGTVFESAFQASIGSDQKSNTSWDLPNKDSISSLIGKMKSTGVLGSASAGGQALASVSVADFKNALHLDNLKSIDAKVAYTMGKKASKGYIPNFADPLNEAISREISAGVNPSQVYIDQNNSLKGPMNPSGLMVANRRDEPSGGLQGINRARKEGANAKTYGAAGGFVPNYAATRDPLTGRFINNQTTYPSLPPIGVNAQQTASSSAARPMAELADSAEEVTKGNRDMLGTLFAVQMGLSALEGATSGATSTMGKAVSVLSGGINSIVQVVFVLSGLKMALAGATTGVLGFASKGLAKAAPLIIGLAAASIAVKTLASLIVPASQKSAQSLEKMALIADKLTSSLSEVQKYEIKKTISKTTGQPTVQSAVGSVANLVGGGALSDTVATLFGSKRGKTAFSTYGNQNVVLENNVTGEQLIQAQEKFISSFVASRSKTPEYRGKSDKEIADFGLKRFEGLTGLGSDKSKVLINQATLDIIQSELEVSDKIYERNKNILTIAEEKTAVEQINLDLAKNQLINAMDLSIAQKRGLDSLDKRLISSKILNNLSKEEVDNLDLLISKRDEDRKLSDSTKSLLQEQINKLNSVTVAKEAQAKLQERLNNLSDADLQSRQTVIDLIKGAKNILIENNKLNESETKELDTKLDLLFGMNQISKDNLDLTREATIETEKQNNLVNNMAAKLKAASSYKLFSGAMAADVGIQAKNLQINRLEESKTGKSDEAIRSIEKEISNLRVGITQDEVSKRDIESVGRARSILQESLPKNIDQQSKEVFSNLANNLDDAINMAKAKESKALENSEERAAYTDAIGKLKELKEATEFQNKSAIESATQQADMAGKTKAVTAALDLFKNSLEEIPQKLAQLSLERGLTTSGKKLREIDYERTTLSQMAQMDKDKKTPEEIAAYQRQRSVKGIGQKFSEAFSETEFDRANRFSDTLVSGAEKFRDTMIDGMVNAIEQGGSLGDILQSAALDFAREMTRANMKNIFSSFMPSPAMGFASGGKITGGSGNKDDVPAMLMGGEYVMNKRAVSKYGTGFMEALNNGSVSGFADGGSVIRSRGLATDVINSSNVGDQTGEGGFQMPGYYGSGAITGKKDLLSYASQAYTSGAGDIIGGGDNSAYIDITPESVRLTNFGRSQGPMAAAVRESKEQSLDLYFQQLAAEKQAKEEEKAQKKAFKRAIITALITSAVGAVVGAGAAGFKAGVAGAGPDAGFMGSLGAGAKGVFTGGDIGGGVMAGGLKNLFSGNYQLSQISDLKGYQQYLSGNPKGIEKFLAGSASKSITGAGGGTLNAWSGDAMGPDGLPSFGTPFDSGLLNGPDGSLLPPIWNPTDPKRGDVLPFVSRATGGRIPQTAGIDTVPAMLSGGEFIMNAGATQRIGASNLNAMNSGASTETSSSAINDQLINKLDELIKITKESSKPVTVNVSSQQGQTGGDNQGEENKSEKDQNLSRKIKAAVIAVLQEEKRLGGVLRRS